MTTVNNPNTVPQSNDQSPNVPHSNTQDQDNVNHDNTVQNNEGAAAQVFNNNRLTSDQVEGLTDTADLEDSDNNEDIAKNPENALQSQGAKRQLATEFDQGSTSAGSEGNQSIRDAAGNLDTDQLIHNLEDNGSGDTSDSPSTNPAPFVAPD